MGQPAMFISKVFTKTEAGSICLLTYSCSTSIMSSYQSPTVLILTLFACCSPSHRQVLWTTHPHTVNISD